MKTPFLQAVAMAGMVLWMPAGAQTLPPKAGILKAMAQANQYFMEIWPDAGNPIFTNIERPSNIWTRAA